MDVAVIGSGIAGLASSIRLTAMGHNVTVFEKNKIPGGKISELNFEGYRFDTGPSLFTLPELVTELFQLCGENINHYLPAVRLDINCKYFYPDNTSLKFYHDRKKLTKELEEKNIDELQSILKRLENSKEVYELSAPVFIFNAFHKFSNFTTPLYKNIFKKLYKLDIFRTMHEANKRDFKDERIIKIFDRYATYNGSNPYKAPATFNMIAHLENNLGAFFPQKGMYALVTELYNLAIRKNVHFRFSEKVEEILIADKKAIGLKTVNKKEFFDLIVSDVDVKYLSDNLIKKYPLRKRLKWEQSSSSALIFYWSVNKVFPELELHNILFSKNYKTEFKDLFQKTISEDPTIYIFISSNVVKTDAPEGCSNWFVMVNAPSDCGQNWETLIKDTRRNIIDKINRTLHMDIEKYIIHEKINSPLTIRENTMSDNGALYGASSNSKFSAFLRHPNFSTSTKNLYFVGGSVHPGGGIPLCLASAKIVCDEINKMI